jgi:hypothetical protein
MLIFLLAFALVFVVPQRLHERWRARFHQDRADFWHKLYVRTDEQARRAVAQTTKFLDELEKR